MMYNGLMKLRKTAAAAAALAVSLTLFPLPVQAEDAGQGQLTGTLSSDNAIVIDRDTGQILDEKNPDERIYPASMTKMMTTILAIENLDASQTITITEEMVDGLLEANASIAGLGIGDEPTAEDLFYCSALPSGADATNALAMTVSGSLDAYVDLMNQKAQEIGMTSTHFNNVTGLHDDNHYSTVRDISLLLEYCLKNEEFEKIFSATVYTTTPLASAPYGLTVRSTSGALHDTAPGYIGGKTGYTPEAGYCIAYWADVNDMHLLGVTAHAEAPIGIVYGPNLEDAAAVLSTVSSDWEKQDVIRTDTVIKTITIHHVFHDETADITAGTGLSLDVPQGTQLTLSSDIPDEVTTTSSPQQLHTTVNVLLGGKQIGSLNLLVTIPSETNIIAKAVRWFQGLFH